MFVPCGKCYNCKMERRNQWTFRLMCESFTHKYSAFLTLTYSDENLVYTRNGIPTLYIPHLNHFFKDLRNCGYKIQYYAIGEYGGKFGRPHYHIIIFYDVEIFFKNFWQYGNLHEASVSNASIHYVSKFHMLPKDSDISNDYACPPFARMSKKLGYDYLGNFLDFNTGEIKKELPCTIYFNGKSYPVPRYYRKLLCTPTDGDFTFYFDELLKKYPEEQARIMLKNAQEAAQRKQQKYNQQKPF